MGKIKSTIKGLTFDMYTLSYIPGLVADTTLSKSRINKMNKAFKAIMKILLSQISFLRNWILAHVLYHSEKYMIFNSRVHQQYQVGWSKI